VKISTRLAIGFGFVLALMIVITAVAATRLQRVRAATTAMVEVEYHKIAIANEIDRGINRQTNDLRNAVLVAGNPEDAKRYLAQVSEATKELNRQKEALAALADAEQDAGLLKALQETGESYVRLRQKVVVLVQANLPDVARNYLLKELKAPQEAYVAASRALVEHYEASMQQAAKDAAASGRLAIMLTLALAALAVASGIAISLVISRSITSGIRRAVVIAERVATGDLSSEIDASSRDEMGQLLQALRTMNQGLQTVVGTVRASSDNIATGSSEIAAGSADLAQRTEHQAANLQQTASSMEQITVTVRHNADTARKATEIACSASAVAEQGGEVMGRVVSTMNEIAGSSKKVAEIVGVIDSIAFQTNILALNAAVEAARAGEQGRGFAVVAGEVRALAQRSAQAAREIKSLIGDSVSSVEAGSRLVGDAGKTMDGIVGQVRQVAQLIEEISIATREQSAGLELVSQSVAQVDKMTQQNAALVEQSTAAAESLKDQAARMVEAVSLFRLAQAA
jgi:methyl-accepting chemotaxis protein